MGIKVILQARMTSSRLPGKVSMLLNDKPMIERQILRIKKSSKISSICVATSTHQSDNPIVKICESLGVEIYRGSLDNVFSRFAEIVDASNDEDIVRLTADCPLFSSDLLEEMLSYYWNSNLEYYSNTILRTYPRGLDIEIFKADLIRRLNKTELSASEKEHVTVAIHSRPDTFRMGNHAQEIDLSLHRWTVDTEKDYDFMKWLYTNFVGREELFNQKDILKLLINFPSKINLEI